VKGSFLELGLSAMPPGLVGLPGKSGVGGGIVSVSPGKGGIGTFAPRLDASGKSARGQLVARFLPEQLGMDLLISQSVR
jgi:glutaminase